MLPRQGKVAVCGFELTINVIHVVVFFPLEKKKIAIIHFIQYRLRTSKMLTEDS